MSQAHRLVLERLDARCRSARAVDEPPRLKAISLKEADLADTEVMPLCPCNASKMLASRLSAKSISPLRSAWDKASGLANGRNSTPSMCGAPAQ